MRKINLPKCSLQTLARFIQHVDLSNNEDGGRQVLERRTQNGGQTGVVLLTDRQVLVFIPATDFIVSSNYRTVG